MGKSDMSHIIEIKEILGRFDERLKNIENLAPAVVANTQEIDRIKTSVLTTKWVFGAIVAAGAFLGITINWPHGNGIELRQ